MSSPLLRSSIPVLFLVALIQVGPSCASAVAAIGTARKLGEMKEEIERQNARIQQLERALATQGAVLEKLKQQLDGEFRSSVPMAASLASSDSYDAAPATPDAGSVQTNQSPPRVSTNRVDETGKSLGGLQLSGDFRYRLDMQARSSNAAAPPLQNIRSRYRLRLNLDRDLDSRFRFHMQLSTGPLNNYLTNDQDFAGIAAKHPFSIAEAYVDFHPNQKIALRGGRMEEVFADNMRFLWDDDIRFNGFQQIVKFPLRSNVLGFKNLEFRAAEYILSNPNVAILASSSPFASAGFQPGQKVRDANLFHPGAVATGDLNRNWSQQFTADIQIYRHPNQIQLASLPSGFPVLISNALGVALSGPLSATGNGTTIPGGAVYSAPNFQIARLAYRVEAKSLRFGHRPMPFWLDVQVSRNAGTSKLRDALIASMNVGSIRGARDVRFLYQFAIKDANALIAQFTDDDLGTGSGVNIAVHALRFDLGLTRFLQFQNLFFIQSQRRPSNPAERFFVPLPRGANATFRYLGQLAFTF